MNWPGTAILRATGCKACALKADAAEPGNTGRITREANETPDGADGPTMRQQPGEVQLRKTTGRASVWNDQAVFCYLRTFAEGLAKGAMRNGALTTLVYNSQAGAEPVSFQKLRAAVGLNSPAADAGPAKNAPRPS